MGNPEGYCGGLPAVSRGSLYLSHTTVHKEFDACYVAAVLRGQKEHDFRNPLRDVLDARVEWTKKPSPSTRRFTPSYDFQSRI
jgi:hypothetical protein